MRIPLFSMLVALFACSGKADTELPDTETDPVETDETDTDVPVVESCQAAVALVSVGSGFSEVTDIQFPPGRSDVGVVLQKAGTAVWWKPADGSKGTLFSIDVPTSVELGLLGLAFAPDFATSGKFYLNYSARTPTRTVVAEWTATNPADLSTSTASETRVLLEFNQPYDNHNGGQLQFGPDGKLYIGTGDGGSANDPQGNGQNTGVLLGKMLRIDVAPSGDLPYTVPSDNPFVGNEAYRPEIWAVGLRNPWRYSFAPDGRLVVGDVGQDRWEEIDIVEKGKNYGWNTMEATHCFPSGDSCDKTGLELPIYEYQHNVGVSITGGYTYTGTEVAGLFGQWVWADLSEGLLHSTILPHDDVAAVVCDIGGYVESPTTFGRDGSGEVYVGSYGDGNIYKLTQASKR